MLQYINSLENKVEDLQGKLNIALNNLFGKSSKKTPELFEKFTIE